MVSFCLIRSSTQSSTPRSGFAAILDRNIQFGLLVIIFFRKTTKADVYFNFLTEAAVINKLLTAKSKHWRVFRVFFDGLNEYKIKKINVILLFFQEIIRV